MIDAHKVNFTVTGRDAAEIEAAAVRIAAAYYGEQEHRLWIHAETKVRAMDDEQPALYEASVIGDAA